MSRKKKEEPEAGLSRRDLLRGVGAAGALMTAGTATAASEKPASAPRSAMRYRPLGKTGLRVSEVGFGGYPVDDPDVVRYAVDQGITYFDTAHCYRGGQSEEVIGEGLQGRRDRVVLATKWCPHHVGKPAVKKSFLDSLRTDYVDVLLNHEVGERSDGEGVRRLQNPEMWEAWEAARKAGKARFLGVSGHDPDLMEVMGHAVGAGKFSVLLGRYSFLDYPKQNELIARAHQKGVAFVAMKTLAGAKGADLDRFRDRQTSFKQAALKWVLSNARLSNLIISMNSRRQVDEYAGASGQKLAAADHEILEEYAGRFSQEVCRFDGACHDACPGDVRIADILRFSMYYHEYEQEGRAVESYARLVASERAAHCAHCAGFCEQACSYDLPVRTLLLKAHRALGEPPREG
jgi:aryl-alcohol dehydrogenase-like predicted oxidoreductase